MESIPEPAVRPPGLNLCLKQLHEIADEENTKRQRFYEDIRKDRKAESINGEVIVHSPVRIEHNNASVLLCTLLKTISRGIA